VTASDAALRPWSEADLALLERLVGDPAMTRHIGGPESPAAIRRRLGRYLAANGRDDGQMSVITVGPDRVPAGSIGYWERDWHGATVWETGWSVLPEFQGRGIATIATRLVIADARGQGRHRCVHAFPSVDNPASNAICRKTGFSLVGPCDFEYPPGNMLRSNDWEVVIG
jgi:RimJ/RimL family protein N-acetyltransferase